VNRPFAIESNLESYQPCILLKMFHDCPTEYELNRAFSNQYLITSETKEMCGTTDSSFQSSNTLQYWHMISHKASESVCCTTVFFNRGFAEAKGSASGIQGLRGTASAQ